MVEGMILNDQYLIKKQIGKGAFGQVYLAEEIETKAIFAIKRIEKVSLEGNDYLFQALWKELEVMKRCHCENSVRLFGHFLFNDYYNIVMELCDTDLDITLSKRKKGFSEEEVREILKQLNNAFAIMDKENIIHRDLKLKNVMVTYDKKNQLGFICKLADFGFSKVMEDDITQTKLGTPTTMAPEVLNNMTYTKKADMWSMGVIIYQLLFKSLPFMARNEKMLLANILNNRTFKIPAGYSLSKTLHDLLSKLMEIDPEKRISWKEYFEHPFFNMNVSSDSTGTNDSSSGFNSLVEELSLSKEKKVNI